MIADAHCHLTVELPAADLVEVMDRGGVDRAVLLATTHDTIRLAGSAATVPGAVPTFAPDPRPFKGVRPQTLLSPLGFAGRISYGGLVRDGTLRAGRILCRIVQRPDNEPVAAALAGHPDRFIALASVNPNDPGHLDEIRRCFDRGFRGVKIHAWFHRVDLRRQLVQTARQCAEAGFPLLIHLGGSRRTGLSILELADRVPSASFIVAHAGMPYYRVLWQAARTHPNLYFDLAGPYMSAELAGLLVTHVPPGRLLFASGGPEGLRAAGGGHSYATARRWVESRLVTRMNEEARQAVMGENLLRLVRLAKPTARRSAAAESPGGLYSSRPGR